MTFSDYHVHTVFSDGADTPEDIVRKAIDMGMPAIGFSDHSYTSFDESYCIDKKRIDEYIDTVKGLRLQYENRIRIYCGIEQDLFSDEPTDRFDYVIGSLHYIKLGREMIPVDEKPEYLIDAANRYFGGDMYGVTDAYFDTVAERFDRIKADIIGHIDLISKFDENNELFDRRSERYLAAAKRCVDKLLTFNKPFEINTGAISRGCRITPYPSEELLDYISRRGGRFVLSSDSHSKNTLCYKFDEIAKSLERIMPV